MNRVKTFTETCGCQWQLQEIPRSMHTREIWSGLCPAHDAEEQAFRTAAREAHRQRTAVESLTEELT